MRQVDWRNWVDRLNGSIQAILFDLDGTLRHNQPSFVHAFYDQAARLGAQDSIEKRRRAARWTHYYWAQSAELETDLQTFPSMDDFFWENYARRSLLAFDCEAEYAQRLAPEVSRYMNQEFQSQDFIPPDVPETLEALRKAGYRLALLSNRSRPCNDYLEQTGLQSYFEFSLVAGEVAAWKPDPEIFEYALHRMGVLAHNCLYVGDNYYADVVGAQRAGLLPVLVDPESVFPDADCPVIQAIGDLQDLLHG